LKAKEKRVKGSIKKMKKMILVHSLDTGTSTRIADFDKTEQFNSVVSSAIPKLTLPRYVPLVIKDASLALWYDGEKDRYVVLCPKCRQWITYDTLGVVYREMVLRERKCCQGCRAKISFAQAPGLIRVFSDFWNRSGNFPESTSWLEATPEQPFNL
jgi:hypothetical protein